MLDLSRLALSDEEIREFVAYYDGVRDVDEQGIAQAQLAKALWGIEEALMDFSAGSLFGPCAEWSWEAEAGIRGDLARRLNEALGAAGIKEPQDAPVP